jgi:hypothetical protein
MEVAKIRLVHALLKQAGLEEQRSTYVAKHSAKGSASLQDLTTTEGNLLIRELQEEEKRANDKMRKKVIHLLALSGYTVPNTNTPDYARIDIFLQTRCGAKNPNKHKLNRLTHTELRGCLSVISAMSAKVK